MTTVYETVRGSLRQVAANSGQPDTAISALAAVSRSLPQATMCPHRINSCFIPVFSRPYLSAVQLFTVCQPSPHSETVYETVRALSKSGVFCAKSCLALDAKSRILVFSEIGGRSLTKAESTVFLPPEDQSRRRKKLSPNPNKGSELFTPAAFSFLWTRLRKESTTC